LTLNKQAENLFEQDLADQPVKGSGLPFNFKRVLERAMRHWYLVVASLLVTVTIAFVINRYTTRIYAVYASIIVKEGTENAAAEFLYKSNPLVTPYRNFYNELYIMRSYPLMQDVVEALNFEVTWYREGNVKTFELYEPNFPVSLHLIKGSPMPYGKSMIFEFTDTDTFTLEYATDDGSNGQSYSGLTYGDTLSINGFRLLARLHHPVKEEVVGKQYRVDFIDPYLLAKQYAGRLKATWAEQGASIINLEITGASPEKEIAFVNKFIERYQQYDLDKKNLVATRSLEFLDRQLATIRDSLNFYDARIENFRSTHFMSEFTAESSRLLDRIQELDIQRAQLTLYENYFSYLEGYIKKSSDFDQIVPPSAVGITDPVLTGLITQLTEVQFSLRILGDLQTEANPLVVERRNRITQLKRDIVEGMNAIRATQKINRQFLDKQIASFERELAKLPGNERLMSDLKRNFSIRENMFLFLLQKRVEAGISRASTSSDVVVVNPPDKRGGPITPKPVQNYAIAAASGLLLPLLVFMLLEVLNDKIQSKDDIEQYTSIPVIGGIGHKGGEENNLVVFNRPRSALSEAFRALRSNLNYFTEGKDKKIILVTSSVSGEGKTFTTVNLATAMAFAHKKAIIIGADMRKPRIYTDFNLKNEKGLSVYLSSMATLDEVIQKTMIEGLDIMTSGPVPPNPSELLMLPKMKAMLEELLKTYDYILLDTPPLGLVSDAFALMPFADHTIFMIRQDYTPRHFLRDLNELYERRELTNISILFNDIKKTGPGYGYGYGYVYGYGYNNRKSGKGGGYYSES
jgi:capsular exopolysaccharide synthesis family protein